jgi:uncharacterized membrane protein YvbJ
MGCPSCGSSNPSGAKFCNECGAAIVKAPAEANLAGAGQLNRQKYPLSAQARQ